MHCLSENIIYSGHLNDICIQKLRNVLFNNRIAHTPNPSHRRWWVAVKCQLLSSDVGEFYVRTTIHKTLKYCQIWISSVLVLVHYNISLSYHTLPTEKKLPYPSFRSSINSFEWSPHHWNVHIVPVKPSITLILHAESKFPQGATRPFDHSPWFPEVTWSLIFQDVRKNYSLVMIFKF